MIGNIAVGSFAVSRSVSVRWLLSP